MKKSTTLKICCLIWTMLIAGSMRASDGELLSYYHTLAYDGDHVTLAANETALVVSTANVSLGLPAWTTIQYKRGTNNYVPITLELGTSGHNLPLSGPGVVLMSSTNWDYANAGPGIVGLKVVRTIHKNDQR